MAFVNATTLDTVRIECLGEARAVTATGRQWVDFRDEWCVLKPRVAALEDRLAWSDEQDELRRLELEDTDAALAECRAREAKANPDPRPWWEKATEAEGGCPL